MGAGLLENANLNGGFPVPVKGEPVRVVAARHSGCGEATRVRLPRALPAGVVRRVRCVSCEEPFLVAEVEEVGPPRIPYAGRLALFQLPSLPSLPELDLSRLPQIDPSSRGWRVASVPIAAAAVIGGLLLIQGGGDDSAGVPGNAAPASKGSASTPPPSGGKPGKAGKAAKTAKDATLVEGSSFTLALPAGWKQTDPSGGATFAASSPDASADATLWIEEDAKLDFPTFIARSMEQLEGLAGSARVVERVPAPTPEETVVRLAADTPPGEASAEVLLRSSGPYRYYLLTTSQPDASAEALAGLGLVISSFTPQGNL